jgi:hypothetical protein
MDKQRFDEDFTMSLVLEKLRKSLNGGNPMWPSLTLIVDFCISIPLRVLQTNPQVGV